MKNDGMHKGHRQRLKKRLTLSGLQGMPEHEVLELILTYSIPYKDVNPLAHNLINHFGSLANVLDAGYEQLKDYNGVGEQTAMFLNFLPQIFDCYLASKDVNTVNMSNVNQCVNYFRANIRPKPIEEFYMFCLDARHQLKKTICIGGGTASSISFTVKELAKHIAGRDVDRLILMHNHPGNNSKPTKADVSATSRVMSICYAMGVKVEDHIIISDKNYFSFLNNGFMDTLNHEVETRMQPVINFNTNLFTTSVPISENE